MNVNLAECTAVKQCRDAVYLCVNDITTGQLWAREDTEVISHEPFQAICRPLHKYTEENHGKPTENLTFFRSKFVPGPSLT